METNDQEEKTTITALQAKINQAVTTLKTISNSLITTKKDPKDKKTKHAGSKNHNKKRNKTRAKMAAKSNQINRIRVKGWKH